MSKIIFIGAIVGAFSVPFAIQGCAGTVGTCTQDSECGAGQTCDTATSTCVGGGEGEGEGAGEGEGEGGGSTCGDLDTGLGAGGGTVTATDANLTSNGTLCDCTAIDGTTCFDLDVSVTGAADADISNSDWINFSANAAGDSAVYAANFCNGSAEACADDGSGGLVCTCGLCLSAAPTDLAVQVHTAVGDSNGVCVNIQ